jgi:hypothetical protein
VFPDATGSSGISFSDILSAKENVTAGKQDNYLGSVRRHINVVVLPTIPASLLFETSILHSVLSPPFLHCIKDCFYASYFKIMKLGRRHE